MKKIIYWVVLVIGIIFMVTTHERKLKDIKICKFVFLNGKKNGPKRFYFKPGAILYHKKYHSFWGICPMVVGMPIFYGGEKNEFDHNLFYFLRLDKYLSGRKIKVEEVVINNFWVEISPEKLQQLLAAAEADKDNKEE